VMVLVYDAFQAVPFQQLNPLALLEGWTITYLRNLSTLFQRGKKESSPMSVGESIEHTGFQEEDLKLNNVKALWHSYFYDVFSFRTFVTQNQIFYRHYLLRFQYYPQYLGIITEEKNQKVIKKTVF
jgi:hypothetical protein